MPRLPKGFGAGWLRSRASPGARDGLGVNPASHNDPSFGFLPSYSSHPTTSEKQRTWLGHNIDLLPSSKSAFSSRIRVNKTFALWVGSFPWVWSGGIQANGGVIANFVNVASMSLRILIRWTPLRHFADNVHLQPSLLPGTIKLLTGMIDLGLVLSMLVFSRCLFCLPCENWHRPESSLYDDFWDQSSPRTRIY